MRTFLRLAIASQLLRFTAIGVASTLAYVVLCALLRVGLMATASNALALVVLRRSIVVPIASATPG